MSIGHKCSVLLVMLVCLSSSLSSQIINSETNPDFVKWLQQRPAAFTSEGRALGEIPPPRKIHTELPAYLKAQLKPREYLAESFDLRTTGGLTPVKNQGNCGSCWTFATMAAIESRWIVSGRGTYDLSEDNLNTCHPPFVWAPCAGGNTYISLAYLARGSGPKSESDDAYGFDHTSVDCPTGLLPQGLVTSGWFIPTTDPSLIKTLILTYGALATNMHWADTSYNSTSKTYYHSRKTSTNHGVTLVGWDDNKGTAGGTGAWIVKNSWGSSWGDGGYFYVAYQDSTFNSTVTLFKDYIDYDPYQTISTYSESGWQTDFGYGTGEADALVKFTASGNVFLTKIGTWVTYPGAVVSIDVYDNFNGTNSLTGLLGSLSNQSCTYSGYYTFNLPTPISISNGNDYYVKVRYQTTGYNYPIPVEYEFAGYNTPTIETGKCWIKSTGGSTWAALETYECDLCIYSYSNTNDITFADGSSYAAPNASPNSSNNPIGRFRLTSQTTGGTLASIAVTFSGTFTGINSVKLWSSSDDTFGGDVQVGSTQSYSSTVTFGALSSSISSSGTYYFVTLDLGESSGSAATAIIDNAALSISGGNLTGTINNAALSQNTISLPVEFTSFSVTTEHSKVELRWGTQTTTNNYGFEIERRKTDQSDWAKIGSVTGSGTSSAPGQYSFSDNVPGTGRYLYRVKQIDNDGTFQYSEHQEVEILAPTKFSMEQNFPNPFNPSTTIQFALPNQAHVLLTIYNSLGQRVGDLLNEEKDAGYHEVQFDATYLASGLYFYRLEAESAGDPNKRFVDVKKMILLK